MQHTFNLCPRLARNDSNEPFIKVAKNLLSYYKLCSKYYNTVYTRTRMMLLFSVTVLLAAAAFDVIKVSIYNIADLQSWEIDIAAPKTVLS